MRTGLDCRLGRPVPGATSGGFAGPSELVEGIGGDSDTSLRAIPETNVAKVTLMNKVVDEAPPAFQRRGYLIGG